MKRTALLALALMTTTSANALRLDLDAPQRITVRGLEEAADLDGSRLEVLGPEGVIHNLPLGRQLELVAGDGTHELRLPPTSSFAFDLRKQHRLVLVDGTIVPVIPDGIYPDPGKDPLGVVAGGDRVIGRFFAPRATSVRLHLFEDPAADAAAVYEARITRNGIWELDVERGRAVAVAWSLAGPLGVSEWSDHETLLADPWSTAVATRNTWHHSGRTLLEVPDYEWRHTDWQRPPRGSWVIYEAHVRDLSAHVSSGAEHAGSYLGLVDRGSRGGINHLERLGVNAVEFLPLQDFGNIELDYDSPDTWIRNTWNPWERNHWGYMTSYFFAPESWYAIDADHERGGWCGLQGLQVSEMKHMVDELHGSGIAVLMDVVYNHVAQYDDNCFKLSDPCYWFRLDDEGNYSSASGCGNDFRTERPLARRLILESLDYWVREYRIDGFRFDLGAMIDDETLRQIHALLEERDIFHTAEPWGGGEYEPQLFAELGWSWWNDIYRVDLRGRHPSESLGALFGKAHGESSPERLTATLAGYTVAAGGFNPQPLQAVNYVAAHDNHDLGDWIRIALHLAEEEQVVPAEERLDFQTLSDEELAVHHLAAFHLLSSGGLPMVHMGQELGRSKLIAEGCPEDLRTGRIDHNSYEKDNATNWIDWRLLERNATLVESYRALIRFRKEHPELATQARVTLAPPTADRISWITEDRRLALVWHSAVEGEWSIELPERMEMRLSCGEILQEGRTVTAGPRSAALFELVGD